MILLSIYEEDAVKNDTLQFAQLLDWKARKNLRSIQEKDRVPPFSRYGILM